MKLSLRRVSNTDPVVTTNSVDWNVASQFSITISSNTSFSFVNHTGGQTIVLRVINSSASNLTVSWPSEVVGADTQISANKTKIYTFIKMGASTYSSSVEF